MESAPDIQKFGAYPVSSIGAEMTSFQSRAHEWRMKECLSVGANLLTPITLANEIARLVTPDHGGGWKRAEWRHPPNDLRLYLDVYSDRHIAPAIRAARPVPASPVKNLAHSPTLFGTVSRDGAEAELIGEYDIQTDEYVFAAFFRRIRIDE